MKNPINFQLQILTALKGSAHDLSNTLDQLVLQDEQMALTETVSLFLDPNVRKQLILALIKDQVLFAQTVNGSYYHENGFDKIVLLQGKNFKMRLHRFYPAASTKPAENIHNHRWNFASAMLCGSFRTVNYDFAKKGERLYHNTYYADKSTGSYTVEQIGKCHVQPAEDNLIERGHVYYMPSHYMHRITGIHPNGATTLILTGLNQAETCVLLSKKPFRNEEQPLKKLTKKQVLISLNHFYHA